MNSKSRLSKELADKKTYKAKFKGTLSTELQGYAMKRLYRDYEEIIKSKLYGISVIPLEENFFIWHCNVYHTETKMCHLQLTFTQNYPNVAPVIEFLSYSQGEKNYNFKNWSNQYTVQYLMLSLFLTIRFDDYNNTYYECYKCNHDSYARPFPPFLKDQVYKITHTDYLTDLKSRLICFHRKTDFKEEPLGVGINIIRLPRTGDIKSIVPVYLLISLKAFDKEKIRVTKNGSFTHWFPIYFGYNKEKYIEKMKKHISMIATGNT